MNKLDKSDHYNKKSLLLNVINRYKKHTHELGSHFFWCADIQQNEERPLYVDKVHYTSAFSKKLAQTISNMIITRKIL